jgi:hypothetical protein
MSLLANPEQSMCNKREMKAERAVGETEERWQFCITESSISPSDDHVGTAFGSIKTI